VGKALLRAAGRFIGGGGLAAAAVLVAGDARAHRPTRAEQWFHGLGRGEAAVPAKGIQLLGATPEGRVRVPGGTFVMGSSPQQLARALEACEREIQGVYCHDDSLLATLMNEQVAHPVTLSSFYMDRTEVTVSDYQRCVSAGACASPAFSPDDARFAHPDFPVTNVSWNDASTYCAWAGGHLPTEAEWEYAARGTQGREFPWGDVYNPHLANHGALANDPTDATDGFVGLARVGSFPDGATPLGILDMAGNAAEWVADVYAMDPRTMRPLGYEDKPEVNPKPRVSSGGWHVIRGGSYDDAPLRLRAAARGVTTQLRTASVGFRCAADTP
jgi:formylglycine-generating enzyme required for sulfatase activity